MIDTSGQKRAILAQYVQGNLVGIPAKQNLPNRRCPSTYAPGRIIKVGFNPLYKVDDGDNIAYPAWHCRNSRKSCRWTSGQKFWFRFCKN